jgi:hypothetical protein
MKIDVETVFNWIALALFTVLAVILLSCFAMGCIADKTPRKYYIDNNGRSMACVYATVD